MNETTVFVSRLNRLERDNRWLKLALGSLLLMLATVALVGSMMPQQIPDVIEAREFRVVDENGVVRAAMYAEGIAFFDVAQNVVWSSPGQ